MRRLSGVLLAGAILVAPAFWHGLGGVSAQAEKTTFTGDLVIMAHAVNADKTADYEQVVAKLKEALSKSEAPEAKEQLAGWRVIKNATPNPDGSVVYLHVITPVKDADYSILANIYGMVKDPTEQRAVYDMYRAALKQVLFVIQGNEIAK